MKKSIVLVALGAAIGWIASTFENTARAASEWQDMGEANGVQAFKFTDAGHTCYVTTPNGGISCPR